MSGEPKRVLGLTREQWDAAVQRMLDMCSLCGGRGLHYAPYYEPDDTEFERPRLGFVTCSACEGRGHFGEDVW